MESNAGPAAKECGGLLEAEKGKEKDCPLKLSNRASPADPF